MSFNISFKDVTNKEELDDVLLENQSKPVIGVLFESVSIFSFNENVEFM